MDKKEQKPENDSRISGVTIILTIIVALGVLGLMWMFGVFDYHDGGLAPDNIDCFYNISSPIFIGLCKTYSIDNCGVRITECLDGASYYCLQYVKVQKEQACIT